MQIRHYEDYITFLQATNSFCSIYFIEQDLLKEVGFKNFSYSQTLTYAPCFSHEVIEEPSAGYKKGSYVAITAYK